MKKGRSSRFFMNWRQSLRVVTLLLYLSAFAAANADTDTPLEIAMRRMSGAYKELSFDLKQPSGANKLHYLALAGTLKAQAQTSRRLVPEKAEALPASQQAAMVKAYQQRIDYLIEWIDSLAQDIQKSQWDEARKAMAAIRQQMIYGHKDFRTED
jgi:soluble cytochrome b562